MNSIILDEKRDFKKLIVNKALEETLSAHQS